MKYFKENHLKISLLGIGAVKIQLEQYSIYIDAVNNFNSLPKFKENDLLLFTHGDEDHFSIDKFQPENINNLIIAPPNVILELYKSTKVQKDKLIDFLPHEYGKPLNYKIDSVDISIFNTPHFIDWQNTHISFLICAEGKKIFVTGDSRIQAEDHKFISDVDCLIYSLLDFDIVKGRLDKRFGKYKHLIEIIELQRSLTPKKIIGNHLLNCDWAVNPGDIKELLKKEKIDNVEIPTSDKDIIDL